MKILLGIIIITLLALGIIALNPQLRDTVIPAPARQHGGQSTASPSAVPGRKAPAGMNTPGVPAGFRGPSGPPHVKGPSGPPPAY